jgi:hypothetical protein
MKIFIFHSNFNAVFCKKLILTSYICKCIYESLKDLNCFILEKGPNSEILNDITEILLKVLLNTIKVDIDLGYCSPNHSKQEALKWKYMHSIITCRVPTEFWNWGYNGVHFLIFHPILMQFFFCKMIIFMSYIP